MADGMSEVQYFPESCFFFILLNDIFFYIYCSFNYNVNVFVGVAVFEYIKKSVAEADASDPRSETETLLDFRQSNHEGDLIDWMQEAWFEKYDGIVINPGAYTHTSIALADAAAAVAPLPIVEVHISDTSRREDFRRISYLAPHCLAQIKGHGFAGYAMAIDLIKKKLGNTV